RWTLCLLVLGLLVLLASGIRYTGEPPIPASAVVGSISGVLNGVAQMSGPPVIVFWMSGPYGPLVLRANFIVFFTLISLSSFTAYLWNGLFTPEAVKLILPLAPAYAVGLFL